MSAKASKNIAAGMSVAIVLILPGMAWAANTPPKANDQSMTTATGSVRTPATLAYTDPDNGIYGGQQLTFTALTLPSHGKLECDPEFVGNYQTIQLGVGVKTSLTAYAMRMKWYYTPNASYSGTDNFTWKVNDGFADSSVVTCSILVRSSYASNSNTTAILVVNALLQPEISAEVSRLQADLQNEGYTVKIKPWSGGDQELFNYLSAEYRTPGQFVSGAILIGSVPFARALQTYEITDYVYMCLDTYRETNTPPRIWVSRMYALNWGDTQSFFGTEVELLKRALQANHDYRTGASRLPHTAYFVDSVTGTNYTNNALDVWPAAEYLRPYLAFVKGGELIDETSHGGPGMYDEGAVTSTSIHEMLAQVRFVCNDSCVTGVPGGVTNNQLLTRGGGNMLSVGASTTTFAGLIEILSPWNADPPFRRLLAQRESWGNAFVAYDAFGDYFRTIFYGDLSLRVMASPSNQMPVVNTLTADKTQGTAPLTVNFSASASDPDGTIANYEWFAEGHTYGKVNPTATGAAQATTAHTYTLPHRYLARVEVADNYKARAWKEVEIEVAPQPGQPVRVKCGRGAPFVPDYTDSQGRLWLYDQPYVAGTWGGVNNINANVWQVWDYFAGDVGGTLGTQADRNALYKTLTADYNRDGSGVSYYVPLANGGYTINLGFADMMNTAAGGRLTDVFLNGTQVLTAFDAVAAFGAKIAGTQSFHVNVTGGMLSINIKTNPGSPGGAAVQSSMGFLNCFEILPDSGPNQPPAIASAPWANPNPVILPNTTTVNVIASDPDAGPSPLTYTWSQVSGPGTVSFSPNGTTASLSSTATFTAAGSYTLRVTVSDGAASVTGDVAVTVNPAPNQAPSIATQPANQTVLAGQTATFGVVATGTAPLSYQWKKNGANISLATASTYTTPATAQADSGTVYSVAVTNTVGSVTSNGATLTVATASDLLAYWKLDDGSGATAADASGNGNTGTLLNGPAWTSGGRIGGALSFDGTNDYVDCGSGAGLNFGSGGAFSYTGWVKTTEGYGPILSQRNSAEGGAVININVGYDGAVTSTGRLMAMVRQNGGTGGFARVTGGVVNDGQWHSFALTRSGSGQIELFLDGVSQGTNTGTQSAGALMTNLRVLGSERRWVQDAYGTPDQQYLNGTLDDVRIYNRALAGTEIAALAKAMKTLKRDFDGDGKADILIRNPANGSVVLWLMK